MRKILAPAFILLIFSVAPALAQDYQHNLPGAGVNYETRLSAVEDQLRATTGKVEQLDFAVRRLDQTLQKMQADYEMRLNKLETAPPPQTVVSVPATTKATLVTETATTAAGSEPANPETSVKGSLGAIKVQGDKVTGGIVNPKAPPLPDTPADFGLTAQEQYDKAFGLLRQASYPEAEQSFKNFIDKFPKDKMIDNAKYWYAETFYVRGRFDEAAVAFADAYQQNTAGTKASDSLLKLAMALGQLDKKDDACATLVSLKSKYPNAPATVRSRADQERTRLKCK